MSNIQNAIAALKAELQQAAQGLSFYKSRVASLEEALAKLDYVDSDGSTSPKLSKRKANQQTTKTISRSGKAAQPATAIPAKLPKTGADFWPSLLRGEPMSSADIYNAAVRALGITPTKDQAKKLAQRQANALSVLCKSKVISRSGVGRDRRYFR